MKVKQLIQNDNFYIGGEGNTSAWLGSETVNDNGSGLYAWLCPSSSEGITVSLEVSVGVTARIEYTVNSVQEIESDSAYWKACDAGSVDCSWSYLSMKVISIDE